MDHEALKRNAGYFNNVLAPAHLVALRSEYAEAARKEDSLLVEFMRECINSAAEVVDREPRSKGYELTLNTGNGLKAILEATAAPYKGHSLSLRVSQAIVRSRREADRTLPVYHATLELRLHDPKGEMDKPLPVSIKALCGKEYSLPQEVKAYTRTILGLNVAEGTTEKIPIIPSKDFYSDEKASEECSKKSKEPTTSFLKKMLRYSTSLAPWHKPPKNTATSTSSRPQ